MNRKRTRSLFAGLCISFAMACQAQTACHPAANATPGFESAAPLLNIMPLAPGHQKLQAHFASKLLGTVDAAAGSAGIREDMRQPPRCGCIPGKFWNCPDRYCNPV